MKAFNKKAIRLKFLELRLRTMFYNMRGSNSDVLMERYYDRPTVNKYSMEWQELYDDLTTNYEVYWKLYTDKIGYADAYTLGDVLA